MGLPDTYVLPRAWKHAKELTGDAVAVPVYRHLAEHLLRPLALAARGGAAEGAARAEPRRDRRTCGRRFGEAEGDCAGGRNRRIKERTHALSLYLVPEAREMLSRDARGQGVSATEWVLRALDRQRAAEGLAPYPRYVPRPRRRASDRRPVTPRARETRRRAAGARKRRRAAERPRPARRAKPPLGG